MSLAAEEQIEHIGESKGCADHDHDLIQELDKRLDSLWRYDQYIANSEGKPDLQSFWQGLKEQDQNNVKRLKALVADEIRDNCF